MRLNIVRDEGDGRGTVVLLHGLTATNRYVVMGSSGLRRSGFDVIAYDARGHGSSDPAPDSKAYEYEDLVSDLAGVIDDHAAGRVVLAGASMGGHTALRYALEHPDRVAGICVITPAYRPEDLRPEAMVQWDRRAAGLRDGGIEGFVEAYGDAGLTGEKREVAMRVVRQRMALHEHPEAIADALEVTPRSRPFAELADLSSISCPSVVVGSRDDFDPGHPLETAEQYAAALPQSELLVEEEGKSPLAWQGGRLSKVIADLAGRAPV